MRHTSLSHAVPSVWFKFPAAFEDDTSKGMHKLGWSSVASCAGAIPSLALKGSGCLSLEGF